MTKKQQVIDYSDQYPGKGPTEISKDLGIPVNTVASALHHKRLERRFNPRPEDLELTINIPGEQLAALSPENRWGMI